ncbi:hypothetical protein PHYSODRAFT_337877 [Phytophthora sojae]|uniref:Uncharacterized protein n=1 Tax=Phytophthora sojae (strain P6497) TaxID=1094619 RepID=G4ZZ91_PHYSP|nr:hypothetical protein PHYSODRAFT_337877 [Phytophthora sojae]EGZ11113.1 hypothetical protein PHYSODRAFT_337877 [Phytophthora sojae]|eukprot:XP_009533858.1 hypothetical protein PHYSODRAFT_337877 [Phytophthora sojae]
MSARAGNRVSIPFSPSRLKLLAQVELGLDGDAVTAADWQLFLVVECLDLDGGSTPGELRGASSWVLHPLGQESSHATLELRQKRQLQDNTGQVGCVGAILLRPFRRLDTPPILRASTVSTHHSGSLHAGLRTSTPNPALDIQRLQQQDDSWVPRNGELALRHPLALTGPKAAVGPQTGRGVLRWIREYLSSVALAGTEFFLCPSSARDAAAASARLARPQKEPMSPSDNSSGIAWSHAAVAVGQGGLTPCMRQALSTREDERQDPASRPGPTTYRRR